MTIHDVIEQEVRNEAITMFAKERNKPLDRVGAWWDNAASQDIKELYLAKARARQSEALREEVETYKRLRRRMMAR